MKGIDVHHAIYDQQREGHSVDCDLSKQWHNTLWWHAESLQISPGFVNHTEETRRLRSTVHFVSPLRPLSCPHAPYRRALTFSVSVFAALCWAAEQPAAYPEPTEPTLMERQGSDGRK